MGNMGYCRFENTVNDMGDCIEVIDETADLSESEEKQRIKFIEACVEVALDYGHEVGRDIMDEEA
jgi:hypothetical protein